MGVDTCNCGARLVPSVRYDKDGPHETLACFEGRAECLTGMKPRIRYCSQCERVLKSKQMQFCSPACTQRARAHLRVTVECPCGETVVTTAQQQARGRGQFCSLVCSARYRRRHTLSVGLAS